MPSGCWSLPDLAWTLSADEVADVPRPDPDGVLQLLRSRRVTRTFTSESVSADALTMILEAGCWASSASNNRILRFLVVQEAESIRLVRALSPGMLGVPPGLIVVCTDLRAAAQAGLQLDKDRSTWIDVGTAAMNMMVQAHALALGTCPVTSFSQAGVSTILRLPGHAVPELMLQVGHSTDGENQQRLKGGRSDRRLKRFVFWDRYGG